MPKVSICIPTYAQVHYLERALKSVLSQRFSDYELIVTDDSPDDSVRQLLDQFDFGGRLRYQHNQPALGSPLNWNYGVQLAQGDYIKILHHDDWFLSDRALGEFVALLESASDIEFAFSGSEVVDEKTNVSRAHVCSSEQLQRIRCNPEVLFYGNLIGAPSATIFRRNIFNEGFDPSLKWLVDIDFYISVIKRARNIAQTADCLIATPTNAGHQVTEECKNSARVEIFEYQYLFKKYEYFLRFDKVSRNFVRHVFERYRIRNFSQICQLDIPVILSEEEFGSLGVRHFLIAKLRNFFNFSQF